MARYGAVLYVVRTGPKPPTERRSPSYPRQPIDPAAFENAAMPPTCRSGDARRSQCAGVGGVDGPICSTARSDIGSTGLHNVSPASQQPGNARIVLGSLAPATYVLAEQQGQKSSSSTQSQNFVHLQPQSPLRVHQAVFLGSIGVRGDIVSIHGLEEEVLKSKPGKT